MIVGLDLSLRASGLVAVPADWAGDWSRVAHAVIGRELGRDAPVRDRVLRLVETAHEIVWFCRFHQARTVVLEGAAFSRSGAGLWERGELSGLVKAALVERGVEIVIVTASAARKTLLGKVPRSAPKVAVLAALRAAGAPFESFDVADAFAVANVVLAERGALAFCVSAVRPASQLSFTTAQVQP